MIKTDVKTLGCLTEKFVSYKKIKEDFIAGREMALIMETPLRAQVTVGNFEKEFDREEMKSVEKDDCKFLHQESRGLLICVHTDSQLWGFHSTIIN